MHVSRRGLLGLGASLAVAGLAFGSRDREGVFLKNTTAESKFLGGREGYVVVMDSRKHMYRWCPGDTLFLTNHQISRIKPDQLDVMIKKGLLTVVS